MPRPEDAYQRFHPRQGDLTLPQQQRLNLLGTAEAVDLHCHCLPGLDDGPPTEADALRLCRALVADGVTTVVATPHQLGRYDLKNAPATIRQSVTRLRELIEGENLPLAVAAGGEVRIDERIVRLLEQDAVMTLADTGRYLLLELPRETFIDASGLVAALTGRGVSVIVSHPERNRFLNRQPELIATLTREGASLLLTAGSLAGEFGRTAYEAAWHWLATGNATMVASDAHGADYRPPRMTAAVERISERLGFETAREVCGRNPLRVAQGLTLLSPESAGPRQRSPLPADATISPPS